MHEAPAKYVARDELAALVKSLRAEGRTIGTLNGSFDLLHSGHLWIIKEAADQADVLILGVNSDVSVRRYKGPTRPICPQEERIAMLSALRWIDYVTLFDEPDPIALLDIIRPDVHTNGSEYGMDCIEAPTVKKHGGKIHIVERIPTLSTSELIRRIQENGC
jgi:rfaE bifunctional protein nucleotidyltransferase chain/domain